jgi:hypothetical protein
MVTDDYRRLPKGRVRPVFGKTRSPLPEWGEPRRPDLKARCIDQNGTFFIAKTSK